MSDEIYCALQAMKELCKLLPQGGLRDRDGICREMDEMIPPDYEPYFSGNAALHLLSRCQRCGRCCREERTITVSIEDCRRIARHMGLSWKAFLMNYTRPHELKVEVVGSARMLKKGEGEPCPFFDPLLPGCRIHLVKPQVCRAAFYLSKMNLLFCQEQKRIGAIPGCPADVLLRRNLAEFRLKLDRTPEGQERLEALFSPYRPEAELFRHLLRLKGMEIYFGEDRAARLARRLGLKRMPENEELRAAAWAYAAVLACQSLLL